MFEGSTLFSKSGRPIDVAYAGLFLAFEEVNCIAGANIPVNGGVIRKMGLSIRAWRTCAGHITLTGDDISDERDKISDFDGDTGVNLLAPGGCLGTKGFRELAAQLKCRGLKPYEKCAAMVDKHWSWIAACCKPENKVFSDLARN